MNRRISLMILLLWAAPFTARAADSPSDEIARAAEALQPQLVEWRRDFHMHPELSNREERTARVIAERLHAMGFDDVKTGVGKGAVNGSC